MTQHDTREAVEAMARRLGSVPMDMTVAEFDEAAVMLRRLLARAEAAEAARDEARDDYEAATMRAANLEAALATARADALQTVKQSLEMTYAVGSEREAPGIERAMRRVQQLIEKEPRHG